MWLVLLVAGLFLAYSVNGGRITALSVMLGISVLLLAYWMSPFSGGRTMKHADVMALPSDERRAVAYWRPGCIFCQRLKGGLGADAKKVIWINIWQDADAAAFVRSVNDGNETVPTVVLDGNVLINPEPRQIRDALAA